MIFSEKIIRYSLYKYNNSASTENKDVKKYKNNKAMKKRTINNLKTVHTFHDFVSLFVMP
ncbi:UNVERIFIED_CONTAM: hypothetical protein NCL1_16419 [Trichonephila clavipes]